MVDDAATEEVEAQPTVKEASDALSTSDEDFAARNQEAFDAFVSSSPTLKDIESKEKEEVEGKKEEGEKETVEEKEVEEEEEEEEKPPPEEEEDEEEKPTEGDEDPWEIIKSLRSQIVELTSKDTLDKAVPETKEDEPERLTAEEWKAKQAEEETTQKGLRIAKEQEIEFLDDEQYGEVMASREALNSALNTVVQAAVQAAMQRVRPITQEAIREEGVRRQAREEFFKMNPDLVPVEPVVSVVAAEVDREMGGDGDVQKYFEEVASRVRKRMAMRVPPKEKKDVKKKPSQKASFTKTKASRGVAGNAPKPPDPFDQRAMIDDLLQGRGL